MEELAIYIHFPYCELKCPYCDFNSHVESNLKEKEHLKAWQSEIDFFLSKINKSFALGSIFFGGGTPSLMQSETVYNILNYIKNHSQILWQNPEITLEANPSSCEYNKFKHFKEAGVNRLSIGVQSFNDANLKFLGRKHSAQEAKEALSMAREIFQNYSLDLIYCLPNQTLESWESELEFAIKNYALGHVSAYTLTIEKGTKFFKMHSEGGFVLPEIEDEFYELTNSIFEKNAFHKYEISNYAKEGFECKHNIAYWQSIDYIGLGAGAHGRLTIDGMRFATQNFANPDKYLNSVSSSENALQKFEALSKEDIIKETLIMNLRYKDGINLDNFEKKYGFKIMENLPKKHIDAMLENNLLELSKSNLHLTKGGLSVANAIVSKLIK
jgi:putative oxygen-independent coproporphyrinogen III oxidase